MMNDKEHKVRLILDKSVAESQRFGCHPCMNTSTLALSMVDIILVDHIVVADDDFVSMVHSGYRFDDCTVI